jgi:hypothetical protein
MLLTLVVILLDFSDYFAYYIAVSLRIIFYRDYLNTG